MLSYQSVLSNAMMDTCSLTHTHLYMLTLMHMFTIALSSSRTIFTHTNTLISHRLRVLLQKLDQGDIPNISEMKKTLLYAADVLLGLVPRRISEEEDE